ncbi:virulence factor SrfC family protein [Soonwooa sp.]|uniref:virulence factor SrfC family protein n=1 Tax=Soonwooa sp. TaxID=1938592 RepID=UPI0026163D05|nr:virulence factor SrfC family protein [Soonwooa sp.]
MDVKNYTPEQVNQIKSYISEKSLLIADSIKWVNGNLKHEDRSKTLLSLKRAQNKLNKIASNIEAKPVIAVFGASQVGKSYLIKNLLSQKGESFKIINNQDSYDFLKDINPAGTGKESTGVVTRFSVDQDIKFVDFPIRIKLLSAKDILTIILDSYFLDLKKISSATINNRRAIESHIKKYELAKDSVKQNYLSEEDVLEVKEYFGNHLSKHTLLFEGLTETRYFERIASIIEYFDYKEWTSIFEILWNNNEDLSVLFSDLLNKLNSIHFTSQGYIKFNDVLRAGGEILDVKRLKELNDNVDSTTLKLEEGSEIQINISYLSALLSELIFSIPKDLTDNKPFLKNSDLLDFPGARSRLGIEEDGIKSNLSDMLLRGKVSYLFNKYSDDYSINNLLFCSNDKQLEVSELSYLLFNWISTNIGSNIDDRSHSLGKSEIYPLFVIFTFFNNQLRYDITNDEGYLINENKLNDKWDTRFVRFFENEVVTKSRDWHTQWSHQSQDFTNFYLLRDYKYSTDTYDGYETENIETEIREERVPFINAMKKTFLSFPFVQKHFRKPEESWHEATDLNKDGSELIIKNLEKVSTNYTKINHYVNLLNNTVEELQRDLSTYIKTDDITEQKNKNMSAMSQFQLQFNMALARDLGVFNELIHQISLQPIEVFNLLNENLYVDTSKIEEGSTAVILQEEVTFITTLQEVIRIGFYQVFRN